MSSPDPAGPSEWIKRQTERFRDTQVPLGRRLYEVVDEIWNQEGTVKSFSTAGRPDPQGEACARSYLQALEQVKKDLLEEAAALGISNEEEMVFWSIHAAISRERGNGTPIPLDLSALYHDLKEKYFGDAVPDVSDNFVCTFAKLPFDAEGLCYLEEDAARLGIKEGIRINEKLREFPAVAKVALLHEMIHAKGIRKHDHVFKTALLEIFGKGAYIEPLIL